MYTTPTVKVKELTTGKVKIINQSKYDANPELYELVRTTEPQQNKPGTKTAGDGKNPDGTFSTPTPTDIRFPDKDKTEFASNHTPKDEQKSAAQVREERGLPDAPGGTDPIDFMKTTAIHISNGNWSIVNEDGSSVLAGLVKADAKAYNDLDLEGRTKFINERKSANESNKS